MRGDDGEFEVTEEVRAVLAIVHSEAHPAAVRRAFRARFCRVQLVASDRRLLASDPSSDFSMSNADRVSRSG